MKSRASTHPLLAQNDPGFLGPARLGTVVDSCMAAHEAPAAAPVFVPRLRDRVRLKDADEIYFVIYVDVRRRIADLACAQRVGFLSNIPFSTILPAAARAAAR